MKRFKMLFQNEIKGIKAIGFDVGHTLIKYKNPLNWQGLYRSGLEHAAAAANITLSEDTALLLGGLKSIEHNRISP